MWWRDHKDRPFHANHELVRVRVHTQADRLMQEAADMLEEPSAVGEEANLSERTPSKSTRKLHPMELKMRIANREKLQERIDLRDEFARAALAGLATAGTFGPDEVAERAYLVADAMMRAREA